MGRNFIYAVLILCAAIVWGSCNSSHTAEKNEEPYIISDSISNIIIKLSPSNDIFIHTIKQELYKNHPDDWYKHSILLEGFVKYAGFLTGNQIYDSSIVNYITKALHSNYTLAYRQQRRLLNIIGFQYCLNGKMDSGEYYTRLQHGMHTESASSDSEFIYSSITLGLIKYAQGKYDSAVNYYLIGKKESLKSKSHHNLNVLEGNLANSLLALQQYERALNSFKSVYNYSIETKDTPSALIAQLSMSGCYSELAQGDQAVSCIEKAHPLFVALSKTNQMSPLIGNDFYLGAGLAYMTAKKYEIAAKMYDSAFNFTLYPGIEYKKYNTIILRNLNLVKMGKCKEALPGLKEAENYLSQLHSSEPILKQNSYEALSQAYHCMGNGDMAYKYIKKVIALKDSITLLQKVSAVSKAENQFDINAKAQIIELQKKEIEAHEKFKVLIYIISALIILIGVAMIIIFLSSRKRRIIEKERQIQMLVNQKTLSAAESERSFFAREIHDGVVPDLLIMKNNLAKTGENFSAKEIDKMINEMRNLSRKLYPTHLETIGFTESIKSYIQSLDQESDVYFSLDIDDKVEGLLTPDTRLHLYRIIQEAAHNIIKHAQATATRISITVNEKYIEIVIQDNGIGFDYFSTISSRTNNIGLHSLKQRTELIGAALEIQSEQGKGTTIKIILSTNQ